MNVLEVLDRELRDKNWNVEEKQRYLYLRSCQIFSYDPRYHLCGLIPNTYLLQEKIRNRVIDLTNVDDNNVVCTSHSKYVLKKLLEELLNIKCQIQGDDHIHLISSTGKRNFKLNATSIDIFMAKMNMSTRGYQLIPKNKNYNIELKDTDLKINYIEHEYENINLEKIKEQILGKYIATCSNSSKNNDEFLSFTMKEIEKLYKNYDMSHNFSDAKFCIDYLTMHFFTDLQLEQIEGVTLFQDTKYQNWDFVKLYAVNLQDDVLYWCLEKSDTNFSFHEISRQDAKHYVKSLKGQNKGMIK